ncbi:uracil-DNA glycosylase [Acetobacter vaccinii]|uniref:Uracil-DNA glycosylase family protein n=1 Tax=Acetobacter vaccinii TaxID=2592655 RepID=A0A5C1YRP0_9PROT|nr:uracil-DNA glycosylase [Acetobacter vaccinii]QEO17597.1 uracil-DNA glycosylase family protein [Acetobacter vaccinii]
MNAEFSLLRLYTEWGIDAAVMDQPVDHRLTNPQALRGPVPHTAAPTLPRTAQPPMANRPAGAPATRRNAAPAASDAVAQASALAAQADSLEALHTAMAGFSACALQATAMHTLLPQGPRNAPLMLIGEAPDADEDRSGQPFTGRCGALLDEMLAPLPLPRAQLALATALPWRPPGGRPASALEQQICLPFLHRAIALLAPRRLLLCGRMPTAMVLGRDTPAPRRQWTSVTLPTLPPLPVLSLPHPLQLRASATARREIWQSLVLVVHTLRQDG